VLWELAGDEDLQRIEALLPRGERIEAQDVARGTRRVAVVVDSRLAGALFLTASGELPPRDWLIAQLAAPDIAPTLLAGRAPGVQTDRGPIICVCFDIGLKTIVAAIRDQSLADVAAIGGALGAGTNCGSCRPALARILTEEQSDAA
jgi:assimilatory nitrate reductase catalytic subunit